MNDYLNRLTLTDEGILHDPASGRKLALNETGIVFWNVLSRSIDMSTAVNELAKIFDIDQERISSDLVDFISVLDKGGLCDGSILPGGNHVVLEPTAACNGGCPHCYHGHHGDKWPRHLDAVAVKRLRAKGTKSVSITGGEVFSSHFVERMFTLVDELRSSEISVASISTNATFITEDICRRILEKVPRTTVFRISLDALRGELLDRLRPGYRNLDDPYGPISELDRAGYQLVFTTNIYKQTSSDIIEIGRYLKSFKNIATWNVRLAVPVHFGGGVRVRSRSRRSRLFEDRPEFMQSFHCFEAILEDHARDPYAFDIRMGNYLSTNLLAFPAGLVALTDPHPCREDKHLTTVKASGEVTQCPILTELDPGLKTGNLFENTGDMLPLVPPLSDLRIDNMECGNCYLRQVCGGGCRLYALAYDQGLDGCDLYARGMLEWMLQDQAGLLASHWPDFLGRLRQLARPTENSVHAV